MIVNLIYDMSQYRLCLDPIRDELVKREHEIVYSKGGPRGGADCSIIIQAPGPVGGSKHPRFFVQHGLSCTKGWGNNQPIEYYFSPAPYWSEELEKRMVGNSGQKIYELVTLGWPKMDCWHRLVQFRDQLRDEIRKKHNLDSRPIVCYWPTYKGGGHSGRPVTVGEVYETLSVEFNCFVGPHQMEGGAKVEYMEGLSEEVRNPGPKQRLILYETVPDWGERTGFISHVPEGARLGKWEKSVWARLAYLVAADALVSDISGIAYEYLAVDQPLVLLDKEEDPNYFRVNHSPKGQKIDMGAKAPLERLVSVVQEEIANPERYSKQRARWRDWVTGPVDGSVTSNLVDFLEKAVSKYHGYGDTE